MPNRKYDYAFYDEFKEFLEELGFVHNGSAADYCSNLGRIDSELFAHNGVNTLQNLASIIGQYPSDTVIAALEDLMWLIEQEKENMRTGSASLLAPHSTMSLPILNNCASALVAYIFFIQNCLSTPTWLTNFVSANAYKPKVTIVNVRVAVNVTVTALTYTQKQLREIFRFRLLTQDRVGANYLVYLPIRHIYCAFRRASMLPVFDQWLDDLIDHIRMAVSPQDYGEFKDVADLSVSSGAISITGVSGRSYTLYGENYTTNLFQPIIVQRLSKVVVMHNPYLGQILNSANAQTSYPNLSRLTNGFPYSPRAVDVWNHIINIAGTSYVSFLNGLLTDMQQLHRQVTLWLMDFSENQKKKNALPTPIPTPCPSNLCRL